MLARSALQSLAGVQQWVAPAALCQLHAACSTRFQATNQQHAASSSTGQAQAGSSTSWWSAVAAALGAAAAASSCTAVALADSEESSLQLASPAQSEEEGDGVSAGGKLLSLPVRQRIFFKYEKRIRDLSTLEKIFEYFATNEKDGRKAMSAQDVVRALVPTYPPVGSTVERAGFLAGERGHSQVAQTAHDAIISFFDHNKDGVIGFDEFVLIVIAMSVPEKDVDVVFDVIDLDNNGVLDADEFMQVLRQLEKRAGIQQKFVGRAGKHSIESDDREMTHKLFEHQEGGGVSLIRFRDFLQRLQDGMLKLEFAHYDMKNKGFMTGADFGNSLVTAADIRTVDKYLDKVQELTPELANARITFKQFEDVAMMRRNRHLVTYALDFCAQIERPLNKDDFTKLVQKTLQIKLAPAVVDIIFAVFGNDQGLLDGPGFVAVMKSRNRVPGYKRGQGLGVGGESDSVSPLLGWWNCVSSCSFTSHDSSHSHAY